MAQTTISAEKKPELTIHYLRPGFEILPPDEVEKRQEGLGSDVYKISPAIVVKHCTRVQFREAQNMLFVEQNTTIPVPKVYVVYSSQISEKFYPEGYAGTKNHINLTYIFMDFVTGATAEDSWDKWDEATIIDVQIELKDYIGQLRGISGGDYVGSLDPEPVTSCMLKHHNGDRGPFDSEEEFNLAIRKAYMNAEAREALISDRLDAMLGAHKHQIKFTQKDLHISDIMVNNGEISSLIDWGDSGWYPDYWEYVSAFRCYNQREDWNTILDNATGRPHSEFFMIERIRQVVLM